jgi:hypothetical protein
MRIRSDVGLSFFGAFEQQGSWGDHGHDATNTMMFLGLSENGEKPSVFWQSKKHIRNMIF